MDGRWTRRGIRREHGGDSAGQAEPGRGMQPPPGRPVGGPGARSPRTGRRRLPCPHASVRPPRRRSRPARYPGPGRRSDRTGRPSGRAVPGRPRGGREWPPAAHPGESPGPSRRGPGSGRRGIPASRPRPRPAADDARRRHLPAPPVHERRRRASSVRYPPRRRSHRARPAGRCRPPPFPPRARPPSPVQASRRPTRPATHSGPTARRTRRRSGGARPPPGRSPSRSGTHRPRTEDLPPSAHHLPSRFQSGRARLAPRVRPDAQTSCHLEGSRPNPSSSRARPRNRLLRARRRVRAVGLGPRYEKWRGQRGGHFPLPDLLVGGEPVNSCATSACSSWAFHPFGGATSSAGAAGCVPDPSCPSCSQLCPLRKPDHSRDSSTIVLGRSSRCRRESWLRVSSADLHEIAAFGLRARWEWSRHRSSHLSNTLWGYHFAGGCSRHSRSTEPEDVPTATSVAGTGMTCGHCASSVRRELGARRGVTAGRVDLASGGHRRQRGSGRPCGGCRRRRRDLLSTGGMTRVWLSRRSSGTGAMPRDRR
ncbi:hypothetical protein YT1_p10003 (plasmid) [Rhodococcus ruber]|nr:hypothetical protein YT1_p10003 [Rhodococcus ruber]